MNINDLIKKCNAADDGFANVFIEGADGVTHEVARVYEDLDGDLIIVAGEEF